MAFHITFLTIFPEMFPGPLGASIAGKALESGEWSMDVVDIRDFAEDKHKTVDDSPFGGGVGMVMRPDALSNAIEHVIEKHNPEKMFYMSPRGKVFTQENVEEISKLENIAVLCGRYEGIDQRIIEEYALEEISLGDFILSGGEIAALALIDACIRLLPSVLSSREAVAEESFGCGKFKNLLEYPHYTRPSEWKGRKVPEVLLSGNHGEIEKWRFDEAVKITKERRRDLWKKHQLLKEEG